MKKLLCVIMVGLMLLGMVGCSEKADPREDEMTVQQEKSEKEINEELKNSAVEAIFTEINGGGWTDKQVYVTGEISLFEEEDNIITFTLTSKEGEGYDIYSVITSGVIDASFSELVDGQKVKIYGVVCEPNELGMPTIYSRIIEKQ